MCVPEADDTKSEGCIEEPKCNEQDGEEPL